MKKPILISSLLILTGCNHNPVIIDNSNEFKIKINTIKEYCNKEYLLLESGNLKDITDKYIHNTLILKDCQKVIKETE